MAYQEVVEKVCQSYADDGEKCAKVLENLSIEDAKCGGRENSAMWKMLKSLIAFDQQFKYYCEKVALSPDKMPSRPTTPANMEAQFSDYKRDRPESPYVIDEKLASELCNRLFFAPRGQKALRGPYEETFAVKDGVIDGGCVSPISPRAAVTFAHKSHGILREYDEGRDDEINQHSLVEIRNCQNHNIRHIMKVIVVDAHHDFVLLFSLNGSTLFEDYPHAVRPPRNFEWFLGFGLSHETEDGQQMTHRTGRICSINVDYRGRYLASSSIDGGDSGGPCYSADRALIGIMVSSTTTSPRLTAEYDRDIIEEEIAEASSNPADTWVSPGIFILEAYQKYLVQHGFLQPRAERELGGPKPKRRAIAKLNV